MVISEEIRSAIKKKGELYESTKEQVIKSIKNYIKIATDKLIEAEFELLDAVNIAFGDNLFFVIIIKR